MPLAGKALMPRDLAHASKLYWQNYDLTKAIATWLAESAGYVGAYHDNISPDGEHVLSRDCGVAEINIPATKIGTEVEATLRTESLDPDEYLPILANNIAAAHHLYEQSWIRDGKTDIRRWQPWVAYTTGIATFPEAWVWHQVNGEPVGPWLPTGRYIHRAIAGQMNNKIVNEKVWTPDVALTYIPRYAEHFGVDPDLFYITKGVIGYKLPPKPTAPPHDGVGPRPVPNDGL